MLACHCVISLFVLILFSNSTLAQAAKEYEGSIGGRQVIFQLEWLPDRAVRGSYSYLNGNQDHFRVSGTNIAEGQLQLTVYSRDVPTARMFLRRGNRADAVVWEGELAGDDRRSLPVIFSRNTDGAKNPGPKAAEQAAKPEVKALGGDDKVVKDTISGILVWRPHDGKIQWTGGANEEGFADGNGILTVFNQKGQPAMIITGNMRNGHLVGDVTARYPTSPERASYSGGYADWAENGTGTMTYNDGNVVFGKWKDGELVSIQPAKAVAVSPESAEPATHTRRESPGIEPPDPDTANENLQKTYDKLKGSLQGDALQNLKVCQRAWIKYKETALQISSSIWDKPNDPWEGADRFDALMAWQRTRELQLVTAILFSPNPDNSLPDDHDEQVARLSGQLRKIHAEGNIKAADMAALKQHWDQSCQLVKLADYRSEPYAQIGSAAAKRLMALAARNLNEVLALWLAMPPEIASASSTPDKVSMPLGQSIQGMAGASDRRSRPPP